jgi:hypothetical protein
LSDLAKLGDLLAFQGAGVFDVSAMGESRWLTTRFVRRTLQACEHFVWEREPSVNVLPYRRVGHYLERIPTSILWARTENGKAASLLRSFKPQPHVVLREGSTIRYVAMWALSDPLEGDYLDRALRRIAHHLTGPKKHCALDFRFYLPGTILRAGRSRPLPVELVRFEPGVLKPREVVGHLKEAPDPEAWKREQALPSYLS